jgi:small subunit ribosomal protein S20
MANTVSSVKRIRTAAKRTEINRMRKTRLRHQVRTLRRLIAGGDAAVAVDALPETFSIVDKAAKQGIIKKNTASRYKSRLAHRVKEMVAAAKP